MKNILNFLVETGKLKNIDRKGVAFYGVKNPDSATDHAFRMAIMAWIFGREKGISLGRAVKMALVHDLCKTLTGDITPYDGLLPKNREERREFVGRWRRLPLGRKEKRQVEKFKKEYDAFRKLTSKLPQKLKKEMAATWLDYYKQASSEARFVHQIDVAENLLEALEQRKKDKKFPTLPWWQHADEVIDDPSLLEFLDEIEKEELKCST